MIQVARSQGKPETPEKKKAEDKGFFIQLPCYLIDEFQDKLTSTAFVAFLRFIRKHSKKGEATYKGSYRALAKELNISHTSAIRITDQWKEAGLATKKEDENSDMLAIFVSLAPIWQKNIEYSKGLDACPNLGKVEQNVTTQPLANGSDVTNNAMPVTNCDTAVTICYNLVTFCSTFEDKTDPRYREITRLLDTFLGARESDPTPKDQPLLEEKKSDALLSYSQGPSETTETEYENKSHSHCIGFMSNLIAELETTLTPFETQLFASSERSWLQENAQVTIDTPSQVSVAVTQVAPPIAEPATSLFPDEPKPARQHNIPANLSMKPDVPEIKPMTSQQIANERKRIERLIWKLIDDEAGAKIGRVFTNPMAELVTSYMDSDYVDEDFVIAVQLVRKQKIKMSFTNIVNSMADAVIERKKIITFPGNTNKQKSIDERFAENERAQKQVEAELAAKKAARLAREAQERMSVAQ